MKDLARGGEPYGVVALPPRSRTPLWFALAKVAPLIFALTTLVPWATLRCPVCWDPIATHALRPLQFEPTVFIGHFPLFVPWGWGVVLSSLVVLWSLSFVEPVQRSAFRVVGIAIGAASLLLPIVIVGVLGDPEHIFVVTPEPGLLLAGAVYLVMVVASLKA